jgi:hypothetical protein
LTPAWATLNNDANLKRLLAAEKLEGSMPITDSPPRETRSIGDSRSSASSSERDSSAPTSKGSKDGHGRSLSHSPDSRKKRKSSDKDHRLTKQFAKPLFEVNLPTPAPTWNKHMKHLVEGTRTENAIQMLEVPAEETSESRDSTPRGSGTMWIETTSSKVFDAPPGQHSTIQVQKNSDAGPTSSVVLEIEPIGKSHSDSGISSTAADAVLY